MTIRRRHSRPQPARAGTAAANRESGVASVEFALIGTLFFMLLFGILTFGLVFALNHTLSHAAAEGARSALTAPTGSTVATAESAATSRLGWLGTGATVAANVEPCVNDATRECVRVVVSYDYAADPLLPPLPGLGIVIPDVMSRSAVVQITQVAP